MSERREKRTYLVYDSRAILGDADDATVLEVVGRYRSPPWREAAQRWGGQSAALYSYRSDNGTLDDERFEGVVR